MNDGVGLARKGSATAAPFRLLVDRLAVTVVADDRMTAARVDCWRIGNGLLPFTADEADA